MRTNTLFETINDYELALCLSLNRSCKLPSIAYFFRVISRLGNGVFWYSLIAALPIAFGMSAWYVSLQMTIVGLVNLAIYKTLKPKLVRNRPYIKTDNIQLHTKPLDEFSFPSGHTFHAFSFSIIACTYFPQLSWVLVPFTASVVLSRVILGLHYPSDVAAGAILGTGMLQRTGLLDFTVVGGVFLEQTLSFLHKQQVDIDYEGKNGPYDLVFTCSDLVVQKIILGANKLVLVQEGMTDPKGVDRNKIRVTGIPNFDDCAQFVENDFPLKDYDLVATSDRRETYKLRIFNI